MKELSLSPPSSRIQELDGLRGIAILSVVILHWVILPISVYFPDSVFVGVLRLTAYGVDLFFVISGFLIGGILLKVRNNPAGVVSFYMRRILRIWPLYYLLLGIAYLYYGGREVFDQIPLWSYFLFIFNFWTHNGFLLPHALGPLWSLVIEEQFYILGPMIFFFLNRKQLLALAVILIVMSPFLRLARLLDANLGSLIFNPAGLDGISMGILLSIFLSSPNIISFLLPRIKPITVATLFLMTVTVLVRMSLQNTLWFSIERSLIVISFGLLLVTVQLYFLSNKRIRVLNSRILRYFGVRCYSIYLFHVFFMILAFMTFRNFLVQLVVQIVLTLGFAHLSWKFIETPLIKIGKRFSYQPRLHQIEKLSATK